MTNILNSVSKKDAKWREIAFNICKDKQDADDLVQDMYLRLYNYKVENWNYSFVILVMWNLFKDKKRSYYYRNTVTYLDFYELVTKDEEFSFNDDDLLILEQIKKLSEDDRKLLELNYDLSASRIAKNLDVCRIALYRKLINIRKEILADDYDKKYRNRRLKWMKK